MKFNYPESAKIEGGHEIKGTPKEARLAFYELAKGKIKYVDHDGMLKWHKDVHERENYWSSASLAMAITELQGEDTDEKWINNLEIVVNMDTFHFDDKDYSDLLPITIEHEIYEAWLSAKKGAAARLDVEKKHLLAIRREYLLAEEQGLGDRLLEYQIARFPRDKKLFLSALETARKILKKT